MRIRTVFATLLVFSTVFCTFSCKKTATDAPIVNIASPVVDDQFMADQDIRIKGDVSDAVNLHGLTIKITDDKTGAVLFTTAPAVHDLKTFNYDVTWKAKITDWTDATISVIAENNAKVVTTKTIKIKIWL